MWVYGSGFPKSLNVSKAIAKRAGGDLTARAAIEFMCKRREELGMSRIEFEKCIFGRSDGNVRNWEDGISLPKPGLWPSIKKAMQLESTPFDAVMERGDREVGRETGSFGYQKDGERWEEERVLREATTEMAKEWDGWGTCLKPACDPIVVARKPLEGTVAANVLKYGTGAINIDACRVPTENESVSNHSRSAEAAISKGKYGDSKAQETYQTAGQQLGRFPANLIHDGSPEVLACFPESKGQCGAVKGTEPSRTGSNGIYGNYNGQHTMSPRGDTGSAARFFYCAKASRSERGEGNVHPTVKPLALMRYLVRLVTRKGGIVLDPFMGSGTTGVAAIQEGMQFIGIERDPHYYEIATRRISAAKPEPPTLTQQELPL
ncbi:MAG: site-specific DNA-methyltransferase [Kiritimatiellae bacterium]|nr:site-specific DNA-methyltransferase [Kiritimatiellia bacterium]